MQPITIKSGTFVCNLYDVANFMRLPLANVRKLWKIMFSAEDENMETIQTVNDWLALNAENTSKTTSAEFNRAQKLHTIFNNLSK